MATPSSLRPHARALARSVAALCLASAVSMLGACGHERKQGSTTRSLASTSQALITQPELYTGNTLAAKELVLTFDDGPGAMTSALSTWLKNRPVPIHATFFVNGACIAQPSLPGNKACSLGPTPNASTILTQVINDGHLVGNHATTHRDLATEVLDEQRVQELSDTDALIAPYLTWNRLFFRAPYGSWSGGSSPSPFTTISASAMNKYVGPIYWNIGGGPTDKSAAAKMAADWECWDLEYTTKQCADRYLNETRSLGRGILLMHDSSGDTENHSLSSGTGNTLDMVKYIVPILEGENFTFKALYEDPTIAAALPTCHASCATCSGPSANQCTGCAGGKFLMGGTCIECSSCSAGTFASAACTANSDTVCTACDPSCSTCSGPGASACTACSNGSFLSAGTCSTCSACGNCDDDDPCTTDTCSATSGCVHEAIAGCAPGSSGASGNASGTSDGSGPPNGDVDAGASVTSEDPGCRISRRTTTAFTPAWLAALGLGLLRRRRRSLLTHR